jgi:hypothetical protein
MDVTADAHFISCLSEIVCLPTALPLNAEPPWPKRKNAQHQNAQARKFLVNPASLARRVSVLSEPFRGQTKEYLCAGILKT